MIPLADDDPIRPGDLDELIRRAYRLPVTREVRRLLAGLRRGDGVAIQRLAKLVEP